MFLSSAYCLYSLGSFATRMVSDIGFSCGEDLERNHKGVGDFHKTHGNIALTITTTTYGVHSWA